MISFRNSKQDSSLFQAQFALSFFTTLLRPDANAALALLGLFGSFYLKRDPIRLYFLFLCMCVFCNAWRSLCEANVVQEYMHGLHLDDAVSGVFWSGDFLTITQIWRTHQRFRAIPTKQVPNTQSLVVIRTWILLLHRQELLWRDTYVRSQCRHCEVCNGHERSPGN